MGVYNSFIFPPCGTYYINFYNYVTTGVSQTTFNSSIKKVVIVSTPEGETMTM
jgi:hypothetical protein